MALGTITKIKHGSAGNFAVNIYTIVGASSYTTSGDSLTAAQLGLKKIYFAKVESSTGWHGKYDITNSKLLAFGDGANTGTTTTSSAQPQAASTTDLSGTTFRIMAWGYR